MVTEVFAKYVILYFAMTAVTLTIQFRRETGNQQSIAQRISLKRKKGQKYIIQDEVEETGATETLLRGICLGAGATDCMCFVNNVHHRKLKPIILVNQCNENHSHNIKYANMFKKIF